MRATIRTSRRASVRRVAMWGCGAQSYWSAGRTCRRVSVWRIWSRASARIAGWAGSAGGGGSEGGGSGGRAGRRGGWAVGSGDQRATWWKGRLDWPFSSAQEAPEGQSSVCETSK